MQYSDAGEDLGEGHQANAVVNAWAAHRPLDGQLPLPPVADACKVAWYRNAAGWAPRSWLTAPASAGWPVVGACQAGTAKVAPPDRRKWDGERAREQCRPRPP